MAKMKPILAELSGKLAGVVFSHNAAGAYVRQKQTPTNPSSVRQQAARSRLAYLSSFYQSLTDSQRSTWQNWGAQNFATDGFGNQIALSAQQAFCACNARNLNIGNAVVVSAPATTNAIAPYAGTVSVTSPGTITLAGAATLGANQKYEVLATPGHSAGRQMSLKQAKWAAVSAAAAGGTIALASAVNFTTGLWTELFVRATDQYGQSNTPIKLRVQAG